MTLITSQCDGLDVNLLPVAPAWATKTSSFTNSLRCLFRDAGTQIGLATFLAHELRRCRAL